MYFNFNSLVSHTQDHWDMDATMADKLVHIPNYDNTQNWPFCRFNLLVGKGQSKIILSSRKNGLNPYFKNQLNRMITLWTRDSIFEGKWRGRKIVLFSYIKKPKTIYKTSKKFHCKREPCRFSGY